MRIPEKTELNVISIDIWLPAGLICLALIISILTLTDFGLTFDEATYLYISDKYISWFSADNMFDKNVILQHWINEAHPPLAKLLSCITTLIFKNFIGGLAGARISTAYIFAALIGLLYFFTHKYYDRKTAIFTCLCLLFMPRVFAHAHLATIEIPITFLWLLTVYSFLRGIRSKTWSIITGIVFGLALATSEKAFLIPIPLIIWAHIYHRKRYANNLICMLFISPILLFALWPRLWHNSGYYFLQYLMRQVDRAVIPLYYMGKTYGHTPVPWHYVITMTLITMPSIIIPLIILGKINIFREQRRGEIGVLLLLNIGILMFIMIMPFSAKYDGVRLFLPIFPFLAILAGRGYSMLCELVSKRTGFLQNWFSRKEIQYTGYTLLLIILIMPGIVGIINIHPYELSYYNSLWGGVKGAHNMGMESTYWGDACTKDVIEHLNFTAGKNAKVAFFAIAPIACRAYKQSGLLREDIDPFADLDNCDWLVLNCRQGFFAPRVWDIYNKRKPIYSVSYDDVPLVNVYRMKPF